MEQVCNHHNPVIITCEQKPPVVMISPEDFQAMEETTYLLRSPANARHLYRIHCRIRSRQWN